MPASSRHALLLTSAATSGFAALVLELVWGRQLALVFGAAQPAAAAVLAAFMLGLGAGSLVGGRLADGAGDPARWVVRLELGLAVVGPAVAMLLVAAPTLVARLSLPDDAWSPAAIAVRLGFALLVIAPPAAAMGAGYPLLARALERDLAGFHRGLGALYAAGTCGGVAGIVAAGFGLIPWWGLPAAVGAAAVADLLAAGAAAVASRFGVAEATPQTAADRWTPPPSAVVAAAALSGALVLAAETLWHRAARIVLANSTATLTVVIGTTLAGLALGGALVVPRLRRPRPLSAWGRLQLLIGVALALEAFALPAVLETLGRMMPAEGWQRVVLPPLGVATAVVLPVTLLAGAAWPLLLAAATPRVADGGRTVGRLGFANSLGAAAGATLAGFALLPAVGLGRALLVLAALHAALAAWATSRRARLAVALAGLVVLGAAVVGSPQPGTVLPPSVALGARHLVAIDESAAGTVVVADGPHGERDMWVDDNAAIGTSYDAVKVVRMLGLLPAVLHPAPRRVLVIGFGAGVTTATVAASPAVRELDVAEIVPAVIRAAPFFEGINRGVLADPRVRVVANDGRNHLLLTERPYDVITCDPIHPLYGSAPLYSEDFFQLARDRLAPGGVMLQYLPLHRLPSRELRRTLAGFQAAFPTAWVAFGLGHAVLVGSAGPLELDWDRWQSRLAEYRHPSDLVAVALSTPAQLAALWILDPSGVAGLAEGPPSTDLHPYLEFLGAAAYRPDLWEANARLLVEGYTSPLDRIRHLPPELVPDLRRLVAGKRLLLFSLLERSRGDLDQAAMWLGRALQVAGDDPEIRHYRDQLSRELRP